MAAITAGLAGRLTVDLGALKLNWLALDRVGGSAIAGAVVKANGYGLGLEQVGTALFDAGARFFFVATPDEGLTLRKLLPQAHAFVLDGLFPGAAALYARERLMPVLSSVAMLQEWLAHCVASSNAWPAALHFDTGMNRLGFRLNEAATVKHLIEEPGWKPEVVMSHFACADEPMHEKNRAQLILFHAVMQNFPGVPASMANSAAILTAREHHFQLLRPGIAMYGGRAVGGRQSPMQRVVALEVPVLQVKEARAGETVGYGATQTLQRDSRLAIIAFGYADGFFRALSSTNNRIGGRAAFRGRIVPVAGRVSMDLVALDVTDLGADLPRPGEMVEILGATLSVDDQADAAGTIGYEILTSLKGRYERVFVDSLGAAQN
jgi:alanine racemase